MQMLGLRIPRNTSWFFNCSQFARLRVDRSLMCGPKFDLEVAATKLSRRRPSPKKSCFSSSKSSPTNAMAVPLYSAAGFNYGFEKFFFAIVVLTGFGLVLAPIFDEKSLENYAEKNKGRRVDNAW